MKKGVLIGALFLSLILLSGFVLAAVPISLPAPQLPAADYGPFAQVATVAKGAINGVAATINYILGGSGFGDISYAKFLLFMLLTIIFLGPAELMLGRQRKNLALLVSIIVSILGLYALPDKAIAAMLLPYNTVGIVVSTIIPIAALAYFLNLFAADLPAIRKLGWILAAVTFIGLMTFRLSDTSSYAISGVIVAVYVVAAALCILMFAFDGTITAFWKSMQIKKGKDKIIYRNIAKQQEELKDVTRWLGSAPPGSHEEKVLLDDMNEIQDKINRLYKQIGK